MTERESVFPFRCQSCGDALCDSPIGTAGICTACGGTSRRKSYDEDYARLSDKHLRAQAAVREWFEAEEAFEAIGIEGFDKPPE